MVQFAINVGWAAITDASLTRYRAVRRALNQPVADLGGAMIAEAVGGHLATLRVLRCATAEVPTRWGRVGH